ncbi:MAG TPA: EamA family transporter [Lacipirellulaceae bacterium]|nr:EamA family transporter [Lacipirellulaceae bacterium]
MAHVAFAFCCFVWGTSFILLERVTHVMGPVEIATWRMFTGAAVVAFCWWWKRDAYRMNWRDLSLITISSLLFTAPPQVIQAYVLEQGFGHGFFGTMVAAIPLLTILVSVPMLNVRPSGRELMGVLGGLACIFLLVEEGVNRGMSPGLLALTMIIPLSSALSNTFYKWKLPHVPAAPLTATVLVTAGLVLLPLQASPQLMTSLRIGAPAESVVTTSAMTYLLLLGVIGSGVSTMAYIWLVLKRGPLFAGMTTYVVPVIALLWGTLDREAISSQQALAIAGVLGMVALVQSGSKVEEETLVPALTTEAMALLPLPVDVDQLVTLPVPEMSRASRRAMQPESQVA